MRQNQAFFVGADSTNTEAPVRDDECHERGYLVHHLTLPKMNRSRAAYFNREEHVVMMERYEGYKNNITAKRNTAAANKAREEC